MIDTNAERRRYYPDEENVPLSVVIEEALREHETAPTPDGNFRLYDYVDREALNHLFTNTSDAEITVEFRLPDVTVSMWSDGGVDVRVTDTNR